MPATTWEEMRVGRQAMRRCKDAIHVIIKDIDTYIVRDLRPTSVTGLEATSTQDWTEYDYDTARSTFCSDMPNLVES